MGMKKSDTGPALFRAVRFARGRLFIIDQTRLPSAVREMRLSSAREAARAIRRLCVRGAPNIGVAAGYALAVEALRLPDARLESGLVRAARTLITARPTAVNLARAVRRVMAATGRESRPEAIRRAAERTARCIEDEEVAGSLAICRHGAKLVTKEARILTICNTGPLAGVGMGTALGVVIEAHRRGKKPRVFACETRPLLQGARLTTLELLRAGVDCTLIVEGAAATVMPDCDMVIAGADRIARNGDTANKVGTRMLAHLARAYRKPFYIAAPGSTFDPDCRDGSAIVVEERGPEEVRRFGACRAAPPAVKAFNPAFDVTPGRLITGFVTEQGIVRPPWRTAITRFLAASSH